MVNAALVARSTGRGFSALGSGGGRATVCGAAASGESAVADGITSGGVSGTGRVCSPSRGRYADIMARLAGPIDVATQGYRNGRDEKRDACCRRTKRTADMVECTGRVLPTGSRQSLDDVACVAVLVCDWPMTACVLSEDRQMLCSASLIAGFRNKFIAKGLFVE